MKLDFFHIVFITLLVFLTVYVPISGYYAIKKLKKDIAGGDHQKKAKFYRDTIIWSWIPLILIFLLIPLSGMSLDDIGIKWIDIETTSWSKWVVYSVIVFYIFHLSFNVYSIISFKRNKESRAKAAKSLPEDSRFFLPLTKKEKQLWSRVSISAGITEEILYRGYLFYALAVVFPSISLIQVLLITTVIFGLAHVYLGKEVIKSALLGLFFGIYYIVFDSVLPIIIIHIAQDLVIRDILEEEI